MKPILTFLHKHGALFLVLLLTLTTSLGIMSLYVKGPLNGNFDHHLMTAKRFGQPAELREHGLTSLYRTKEDKGWDGQFYYFMANDLFATKDSPQHMDSDAYRYQRGGLPIVAKVLSLVLLQDWVSPKVYYASSLLLVLLATLYGAALFRRHGISPYFILFWSLAVGTQLTMLNGLPDAAADALLIIALTALLDKKQLLYSVAMTLAVLSREAYILLPFFIAAASIVIHLREPLNRQRGEIRRLLHSREMLCHLAPLFLFGLWQCWIRLRFSGTTVEQAQGILGLPLLSLWQHMMAGIAGTYPGLAAGEESYFAALNLLFFLSLLLMTVFVVIRMLKHHWQDRASALVLGIGTGALALMLLYMHFGVTVMWHFSGFMKAGTLLTFLLPLCYALQKKKFPVLMTFFLVIMTLYFGFRLWDFRLRWSAILLQDDVRCEEMAFQKNPSSCLSQFVWRGNNLSLKWGHVSGSAAIALADIDPAGLITFGPYIAAPKGAYRATLRYSAISIEGNPAPGRWDVFSSHFKSGPMILQTGVLVADQRSASIDFMLEEDIPDLEVRTFTDGRSNIRIESLSIEQRRVEPAIPTPSQEQP